MVFGVTSKSWARSVVDAIFGAFASSAQFVEVSELDGDVLGRFMRVCIEARL